MAEPSKKPQKYIPNPFEAQALKELKQPWRFYNSKDAFERKVAKYEKAKLQTPNGEISQWQAARVNALVSFGAQLFDYEEESLAKAEKQIRNNKPLWSKIQAAHIYNSAGFTPEIDVEHSDLKAEDIFQKINENIDKMEKGSFVDGKYSPTKAERDVLRALGNYGEFIRNPKDKKEEIKFYDEIKKRFGRIAKRDDYQKFEPKQQKKQSEKAKRKEKAMSDEIQDNKFELTDEQKEFCKAHNLNPDNIKSDEDYKAAVEKFGNQNEKDDAAKTDENGGKGDKKTADENGDKKTADENGDKTNTDQKPLHITEEQPQPEEKNNEETPDWVKKKAEWYKSQAEEGKIEGYEQDTSKEGFSAKFNNAEIHYSSPDNVTVSPDADYKVFDTMLKEPDNKGRPIEFPDNASKEVSTRLYAACVLNGNPMQGAVPTELDAETLAKCGLSEEQIKQVQDHLAASQNKNNGNENANESAEKAEKEHQLSDKAKEDIKKISEIKKNFEQMKKDGLIAIKQDENGKPQIVAGEKGSEKDVENATAIMKEASDLVKSGLAENRGKDSAKLETQQQKDTNAAYREQQRNVMTGSLSEKQIKEHEDRVAARLEKHAAKLGMLSEGEVKGKDENTTAKALEGQQRAEYAAKLSPATMAAIQQKYGKGRA